MSGSFPEEPSHVFASIDRIYRKRIIDGYLSSVCFAGVGVIAVIRVGDGVDGSDGINDGIGVVGVGVVGVGHGTANRHHRKKNKRPSATTCLGDR